MNKRFEYENQATEIRLLKRLGDASPDPSKHAIAHGRELLRRATEGEAPASARASSPRRRWGFTLAAAAAVTAGLLVFQTTAPEQLNTTPRASAAALLTQAADAAIGSTDPIIGPEQYLKITARERNLDGSELGNGGRGLFWVSLESFETWVPGRRDEDWFYYRSGRAAEEVIKPKDASLADVARAMGESDAGRVRARRGPSAESTLGSWQTPTYGWLDTLPRDPAKLLDVIYRDSAGSGLGKHSEALVYVSDVLRSGIVPADLRAALFRALTLVPGMTVTQEQANLDGRTGVAVGLVNEAQVASDIVFDPATGQVIGQRSTSAGLRSGQPVGTVLSSTSVATEVVDSVPNPGRFKAGPATTGSD